MKNLTDLQPLSRLGIDINRSLLEQTFEATRQMTRMQAKELLQVLIEQAMTGTLTWNKNIMLTIQAAIGAIDARISQQLSQVMHHEKFKKLEGSWRGLHYVAQNTETNQYLRLKVLNVSKSTLAKDLHRASDFDQSVLFKKIYENEFGSPGGEPYGVLVGDYEFTNQPDDIDMLGRIANVAASAFCPFVSAADPQLFGLKEWNDLSRPRDLEKIFATAEYAKWRSLRESEDSRFLALVLPRVLARLPYGRDTHPVEEFDFNELAGVAPPVSPSSTDYCWMNASYVLAVRLTQAFAQNGWCTSIRGAEGGGRVENLPLHSFTCDDGDMDATCPTEIAITDRREAELCRLGFLPLCHYKNTDYAVFFGAQSLQKPDKYHQPEANANAAISVRLPYILATSRFAHYLKVMARDKIGSFMEISEVELWLNRWINGYVNGNAQSGQEMKAKYPLAEARIQVANVVGKPGAYQAIAWLKPWLQLEELTTSLRLVANIPHREE